MNILKKYPIYRRFLLNNFISTLGDSMYYVALLAYAAQFPKPGVAILMVSLSETLPGVFAIITGSIADMSLNKTQKTMIIGVIRGLLYVIVGVLIGFDESLLLLGGIVVINFISDIIGKYSGGLMTPFILYIVKAEDVEEAQGLSGAISQTVALLAQFVGAFLMAIFSYQILAWINSLTFFLAVIVIYSISKLLINIEKEKIAPNQHRHTFSLKNMWQQIKLSFKEIRKKPSVYHPTMMFALANGGLSALFPLLSLLLAENNQLLFRSFAFTYACLQGILSVGLITGNLVGPKLFRKISLSTLCQFIFIGMTLTAGAFLSKQISLIMLILFVLGGLVGSASTKLNALIVTSFEVDKLATIVGGLNTLLSVTPPLATTLFSGIAAYSLSTSLILLIVFSISACCTNLFLKASKDRNSSDG